MQLGADYIKTYKTTDSGANWTEMANLFDVAKVNHNHDSLYSKIGIIPAVFNNSRNFNDYITTGFYRVQDTMNLYTNGPSTAGSYGQLIISALGDTVTQIYTAFSGGSIYFRCFSLENRNVGWNLLGGVTKYVVDVAFNNGIADVTMTWRNVAYIVAVSGEASNVCVSYAVVEDTPNSYKIRLHAIYEGQNFSGTTKVRILYYQY